MTKPKLLDTPPIEETETAVPSAAAPATAATPPDGAGAAVVPQVDQEQLDEEEQEFRAMRRDLPGVKGAGAAGIVAISVGKAPTKDEFFRTHAEFRPTVAMVDLEVGMERQFFAVSKEMVTALHGIGITVTDHVLYLTVTARGA